MRLRPDSFTTTAPHCRNTFSVDGIVVAFIAASLPCFVFGVWNTGLRWAGPDATTLEVISSGLGVTLPPLFLLLAVAFALSEANRYLRGEPSDKGWLVTSWFFVLLLPPDFAIAPAVVALVFALVFSHFVFGGYGMAPFHPAIAGMVFLSVSFGDPGRAIQVAPDEVVTATWFAAVAGEGSGDLWAAFVGGQPGGLAATSPMLSMFGALLLLLAGCASKRTILAGIAGVVIAAAVLPVPEDAHPLLATWYGHLLLGQFAFVLVFIAADPAAQALTPAGRWVAGFSFGFLTVLLRLNDPTHPEGTIPALFLVSLCAPLADAIVIRLAVWRRRGLRHA